jgi:hypothetical protein
MKTWVTDVRHWAPGDEAGIPAAAQRRGEFTGEIVGAATSRRGEGVWRSAVLCIGRVGRRTCAAWIDVARVELGRIEWSCGTCGERGVITGFEEAELDLSPYIPRTKPVLWGLDQESRDVLYAATALIPSLRAIVARASPVAEIEGFLRVDATIDELDELYTLIEQLTDLTRSRRRIELLDDLRRSLCGAMDRF